MRRLIYRMYDDNLQSMEAAMQLLGYLDKKERR